MPFAFEVPFEQLQANIDGYIESVFGALQSEFLEMPKGEGFVEYAVFEQGYEALKQATGGFRDLPHEAVLDAVYRVPIAFVVLRTMLGFTPPEWAYVTTQSGQGEVPQGAVRTLDRRIRQNPLVPIEPDASVRSTRLRALTATACRLLTDGVPKEVPGLIHRLDKADTRQGVRSLQPLADLGVPYAMLLYERFLGRPFAGHRDSVSELVGDVVEAAVERVLTEAGISFRKTKRAGRVEGFDQAPDFVVPDEFHPQVVIEAKLSEDDGTARDKVTRVQHLATLSMQGVKSNRKPRFEVVACIAGRGFKVRREDMRKLLLATRGKVFPLRHLDRLIDCTELSKFRTRR